MNMRMERLLAARAVATLAGRYLQTGQSIEAWRAVWDADVLTFAERTLLLDLIEEACNMPPADIAKAGTGERQRCKSH